MNDVNSGIDEEELTARHEQRIREMKRRKRMQARRRRILRKRILPLAGILLCMIFLISMGVKALRQNFNADSEPSKVSEITDTENIGDDKDAAEKTGTQTGNTGTEKAESGNAEAESAETENMEAGVESTGTGSENTAAGNQVFSASATEDTVQLGGDIVSNYAVIINTEADTILAQKGARTTVNPASMTKVLTVLVAAEHITDLEATFTMTGDIIGYCFKNDCSNAGFSEGEAVSVRDLFYGAVLPSGGEAALGLAVHVAGSQEAFVKLMNDKLAELGLSGTAHFTNCVGLYDKGHYCSVYDMAVIMEAAMANDFCREVLSAHTYTTSATEEHPEGLELSNWFLRRIEDKDSGGEVIGGKTGYVVQSGNCAVSYGTDSEGKGYVCATADASSGWRCIYDHVALYKRFIG